jgi:type II secretory pathway component GspD/PulD (secretin)
MRRERRKIKVNPQHQCIGVGVKGRNFLLLCVIVITVTAAAAIGQTEPNQTEPNRTADNEPVLLDQADSGLIIDYQQRTVAEDSFLDQPVQCINFKKDMSVRDALRFLAAKYHRNIIPSGQVIGKLNVTSLYEVTFEEALDAILGSDYRYKTTGGFIRVYTAEEYEKLAKNIENMTSRVFELYYVNAAEVKALITPVMSQFGKIASTTPAALDTEAGQGGDKLSMRDTIVVYDFPERLDKVAEIIKEIDVKPQQILIEVTVLKATLTETTEFGIEWDKIGGITATSTPVGMSIGLASGITPVGSGLSVGLTNDEIVSSITALEDVTDVTVLANPKIMALNKQAGYINIGGQKGYTESITQTSGGNTTANVKMLDYGTILKFRPFICENGYVRMEINPEESIATTTTTVSGNVIPNTTKTTVKTNIMVKDGRTIIIGGLFKEELTNTDSQVPVIGDLPIVGALFKKTKDANIRTELVILITPHIINEPEELASASEERENDISRIVHGSRKRISSISRVRIYEDCYAKAIEYYADKEYDKALAELNWIIGFRPNTVEAVQLKEKILSDVRPDKYRALERIMYEQIQKEQNTMWKRR